MLDKRGLATSGVTRNAQELARLHRKRNIRERPNAVGAVTPIGLTLRRSALTLALCLGRIIRERDVLEANDGIGAISRGVIRSLASCTVDHSVIRLRAVDRVACIPRHALTSCRSRTYEQAVLCQRKNLGSKRVIVDRGGNRHAGSAQRMRKMRGKRHVKVQAAQKIFLQQNLSR